MKTTLVLQDAVNCRFLGLDPVTRKNVLEKLKFFVPYARHTPQYKLRRWDGRVSFGTLSGTTFINLLDLVLPVVMQAGYEVEIDDKRVEHGFAFAPIDDEYVADRSWPLGHDMAGEPIMLRDYQVDAVNRFLEHGQSIQNVATGAGKTLITACLSRMTEPYGRSIVIVPSKDLVRQTEADYRMIGLDVGVYYGDRKEFGHQHTICTWQGLAAFDKQTKAGASPIPLAEFLRDVVLVIVDEVHTAKQNVLKDMLCETFADVPLRWGLTGTIPKEEFEAVSLLAALGPLVGEIRAVDLQELEVLAHCDIKILQLNDNHVEFPDYTTEHEFLLSDPTRLRWIAEYCQALVESEDGNTLVLVGRIETGKSLARAIEGAVFVSGITKSEARKKEYDEIATVDHKLIVATYGVAAVGINIPRLFNCVLIEPGRSFVRTIQSIGRTLRRAHDKEHATIYDITSNLKFAKRHITKRKEYYTEAGYPFKVTKIAYRVAT